MSIDFYCLSMGFQPAADQEWDRPTRDVGLWNVYGHPVLGIVAKHDLKNVKKPKASINII